jgi:hypothetical protein
MQTFIDKQRYFGKKPFQQFAQILCEKFVQSASLPKFGAQGPCARRRKKGVISHPFAL